MYRRIASLAPLALLAPLLAGCAPDSPEDRLAEAIGTTAAAIQGGYADDFDTHVVGIVHLSGFGFGACSGTLIAPNVVLTAQHCVAQKSGGAGVNCATDVFGASYNANELYITTVPTFTQNINDYHLSAEVHVAPDGPKICGRDQAIIILAEPISAEEATPAIPRVDTTLGAETYYAIGYGERSDGGGNSGSRYRRDDLTVDCVGTECGLPNFVFPQEWVGETAVCSGDSGGPAMDMANRVIGVASRGSSGCEFPVYGHVFSLGQWIKDLTLYASGLAGLEPPPWATGYPTDPAFSHPIGDPCNSVEECPSNVCLDGYCSRLCNDSAPCTEGYQCNADGFCEQLPEPDPPKAQPKSGDDDVEVTSGCNYSDADPTKPIPWKTGPILIGALALLLRRRRRA